MKCVEIVLAHAGQRSVLSLREVLRCGRVSRRWREACVYVFLYACMFVLNSTIIIYVCMHACLSVCLFLRMYVCVYVCMCVFHVCMHLRMYV